MNMFRITSSLDAAACGAMTIVQPQTFAVSHGDCFNGPMLHWRFVDGYRVKRVRGRWTRHTPKRPAETIEEAYARRFGGRGDIA